MKHADANDEISATKRVRMIHTTSYNYKLYVVDEVHWVATDTAERWQRNRIADILPDHDENPVKSKVNGEIKQAQSKQEPTEKVATEPVAEAPRFPNRKNRVKKPKE